MAKTLIFFAMFLGACSPVFGETVAASFTSITDVPVTAASYTAAGNDVSFSLGFAPATGTDLMVVRNTGLPFISGQFSNLTQGQYLELSFSGITYGFVANYFGGTGNDLVLHWSRRNAMAWGLNTSGWLGDGTQTNKALPAAVTETGALSGKTLIAVDAGASHSLALCSDGTVAAWGTNSLGQLGVGTTTNSTVPLAVNTQGVLLGRNVVAIAAGVSFSLALCSDGTLAAWGANGSRQLGDGTASNSSVPVAVDATGALAGKTVVAISAGGNGSLALCSDGSVATWGQGALGPAMVSQTGVLAGKIVTAIACGFSHRLALTSDGKVFSWGTGSSGQLGNGSFVSSSEPVAVVGNGIMSGKTVVSISAGDYHSVVACSDGTVASWGDNGYGQLGDGSTTDSNKPVAVNRGVFSGRTIIQLSSGGDHSLALCSDGTATAWGSNAFGQLGNGTNVSVNVPAEVSFQGSASAGLVRAISAGNSYNLAITGTSPNSRLSTLSMSSGTLVPAFSPSATLYSVIVSAATESIVLTSSVQIASSAVRVNGLEIASGSPSGNIPLLVGRNTIPIVVTAVNGSSTTYSLDILRSSDINFVYQTAGDIPVGFPRYDATGLSANMSLGFPPATGTNLMVVNNTGIGLITGHFNNLAQGQVIAMSYNGASYDFVVNYFGGNGNDLVLEWARRSVVAWGSNNDGQLGNDTLYQAARVPVGVFDTGVLSGKTVLSVAAGDSHSLALCSDGTMASWGKGFSGQLGKQGTSFSVVPVPVTDTGILAGKTVVAISSAFLNNLALCSDGTVASWGSGGFSQLGNGTTSKSSVPVAVTRTSALVGRSVVSISVGGNHCLALCSDGKVVAWGKNTYGQLGNGTTLDSGEPVLVPNNGALSGRTVVAVTTGLYHSLALCSDGTVAAWGRNAFGQLGNGNTTDSAVPVSVIRTGVLSGKAVKALSQGAEQHTVVLCDDGTLASWGYNINGQLGNGTSATFSATPVKVIDTGVLVGKTVVGVSSGFQHNIAICSDGLVATWGGNYEGALGNNSNIGFSNVPLAVTSTGELYGRKALSGAGGVHCLVVTANPVGGYLGWISGRTGLSDKTEAADPEGDGIPNLIEYVLNGDPAKTSTTILPTVSAEGGDFVFSFNRLFSTARDTSQVFQYSNDMIHWTEISITVPAEAPVALGIPDETGNQSVIVTVPKEANNRMFGRLIVSRP